MYLALYRKYRPKTFEDVISQPHITVTLKNEVRDNRTAHAYLFTGPRGTGKTTCSQILAMAVNCEHPKDGNPCLECDSCKAIGQGATMDVVEIDAASNNGVDNIRDLREEANYTPAQCRYRVYIIDEAHMLSTGAFNALLKIMEEPPEHVKFILATTEAHKVPATILSRCQRFDFRRVRTADIQKRLLQIAGQEDFTLTEDAAELIARLADGGMRDAFSLVDQCAAFEKEITLDTVVQAAGVVGRDYLYELTDCIQKSDPARAILAVDRLYAMSKDMQGLLEELLHHFRNILLTQTLRKPDEMVEVLPGEKEKLREYAKALPLPVILDSMTQMQNCLERMSRNVDRRLSLELCIVRLCSPELQVTTEGLAGRLERLERQMKRGIAAEPEIAPPPVVQPPEELLAPTPAEEKAAPTPTPAEEPIEELPALIPAEEPIEELPALIPAEEEPAPVPVEKKPAPKQKKAELRPLEEWGNILTALSRTDMPLYSILRDSQAFTDGAVLCVDSPLSLAAKMIKQEGNAAKLIAAAEAETGVRYRLLFKKSAEPEQQDDPLTALLERARENGVEVREEQNES